MIPLQETENRVRARESELPAHTPVRPGERIALFGAGHAGVALAREIRARGGYPLFFLDDRPELHGQVREGLPVFPPDALAAWHPLLDCVFITCLNPEPIQTRLAPMGYTRDESGHGHLARVHPQSAPYSRPTPRAPNCPVCRLEVTAWKPFVRRVGADEVRMEPGGRLCPWCGSFERTRHFILFLGQRGLLAKRPRMLHCAPEPGLQARLRAELGAAYVTTDLQAGHVDAPADLTSLPFPYHSLDLIYCSNVLEHIPNDRQALRELFRVLARGGMAYIQVPVDGATTQEDLSITDPATRTRLFGQADHVRLYGRDVADRIMQAGFQVEATVMPDALGLADEQLELINGKKRELVHLAYKPFLQ